MSNFYYFFVIFYFLRKLYNYYLFSLSFISEKMLDNRYRPINSRNKIILFVIGDKMKELFVIVDEMKEFCKTNYLII